MPSENDYGGMTLNERIYTADEMDNWDKAVQSRNRAELLRILEKVEIRGLAATKTIDQVLGTQP